MFTCTGHCELILRETIPLENFRKAAYLATRRRRFLMPETAFLSWFKVRDRGVSVMPAVIAVKEGRKG